MIINDLYNNKKTAVAEATGDEKFDTMMGRIQQEPKYPDSQMPPTDVKDLYQWAVKNNKPYHKIFAEWAMREGYKSVAPALQKAGNLDSDALDYWTPDVWKIYWGEVRGIDSEMPPEWAKKRIPAELRYYLDDVFDAYDRIVFDWPTEYLQIGQQGMAEGKRPDTYHIVNKDGKPASLASYADKESAVKDRDAKHQGAEVRQLGPRGKVKGVSEAHDAAAKEIHGNLFHDSIPPGAEKHHVSAVLKAHGLKDTDAKDVINRVRKMGYTGSRLDKSEVDEVSDKTLINYLHKVSDDSLKHDQDPTKRSAEKRNRSVTGFSRAFNKLDSRKPDGSIKENNTGPVTHRIGLTVTDPNHPMVSKRGEQYQKSVRITQEVPDREAAINQAIAHYRRKGYKVHDHHYIGTVDDEPIAEVNLGDYRKKAQLSKAMAQTNKFFGRDDPEAVAQADQTIAKRERGMTRADARVNPYTPPVHDAEKYQRDLTAKYPNIDELVRRAELNRDPNYEMADGQAYYAGREAEQNYQKLKQIQRVIQGLNESHVPFKKNYLYEGLDRDSVKTVKLWESAGQRIVEAQLTADQINQLFAAAEQGANDAGGNRTMIGKGKDAAVAVNKAWETLKDKVQTSGPIKSMDAAYDTAADKLKQATGGDQGVMKYVQKYRDFAKKHPVAQSLIYSALIAAAGISGAGLGGAAALGLFKLVDKLLQGEKFSSAAYAGAKTGAMAYGASKVADYFKGPKAPEGGGGLDPNDPDVAEFNRDVADMRGYDNYMTKNPTSSLSPEQYATKIGKASALTPDGAELTSQAGMMNNLASKMGLPPGAHQATFQGGVPVTIDGKAVPLDLLTQDQQRNIEAARAMRQAMSGSQSLAQKAAAAAAAPDKTYESLDAASSRKLTETDLYFLFSAATQLNEGIWDSIKGTAGKAVGSAVDWAKTKGTNLTTKVTADKLKSAWLKADSPTDSDQVYGIMIQAGVAPQVLDTVYKSMNVPTFKEKALAKPTTPPVSGAAPTAPTAPAATTPAATPAPAATTPAGPPGFNAGNLAQLPGMAQYMKPQAKATPNYGGSTGYGKTTMTVNPMQAKAPAAPAPTAKSAPAAKPVAPTTTPAPKKEPITIGGQKITPNDPAYDKIMKNAPATTTTPVATPTATTSKPAVSPLRGSDPRFPNGKYDEVTGQPTPEWQAELAKQNAAKQAATTTTSATARPPVTTATRPTAVPKTDAEMDAVEKAQIEKMKTKNSNLSRLMALDDELAESLTWSQNFNPGRSLYRRMKQDR